MSESTTSSLPTLLSAIGDAPLPPPRSITRRIPPFHRHGAHNCGQHQHEPNLKNAEASANGRDNRTARPSAIAPPAPCSRCEATVAAGELHDLPCGHLLCRACLVVRATNTISLVEDGAWHIEMDKRLAAYASLGRRIRIMSMQRHGGETDAAEREGYYQRRRLKLRLEVLALAGMVCCGRPMRLGRFAACLPRDVSACYWICVQWLAEAPAARRLCGWPDCARLLPQSCQYRSPRGGNADGLDRYYCPHCGGNSMAKGRQVLRAAQDAFPWLPRGQPMLQPAR